MIDVFNTGLSYVLINNGRSLCSFSSRKSAAKRALELSKEFGVSLSPLLKHWIKLFDLY